MEVLCYFLALSLSVLYCPQPTIGQGSNLVCRTDLTTCCRGPGHDATSQGDWYNPTGGRVTFPSESFLPSGQIYRLRAGPQVVRIRRQRASATTANGIYRCEVADQNGVMQTRYVGLYTEGAGVGVVSISQDPQFSLISEDPLEFTLTSTTTGGPPTTATWTLPNTAMATGDQVLLNAMNANVSHTLTLTERMPGVYMFSTTNARSDPRITTSTTVQAANPPTGLMAVQASLTSILVSWTAPAPGGANVTGYRISYQTGGGSEQTVIATLTMDTTSLPLTGLQSGATYSISIETRSNQLPSARVGPVAVVVKAFVGPTVTTQVLGPTSIRVIFTQPSGSLAAESYDIQYTRVTGAGQTQCGSVEDTGAITDVQSPFTITNLEEFSSYDITVTARVFSTTRTTTERAMKSPAVPSCSGGIAGAVVGSSLATVLLYTAILLPVILCWNKKKQLKYPVTSAIQPPAPVYAEVSTFKLPEKPGPIELEPNAAYGGVAVSTTAQAQVEEHPYEL